MTVRYNPLVQPNAKRWLKTDETERLRSVLDYHRRAGVELPAEQAHAAIHSAVETQVAMGDETPAAETLKRLMDEGLDRHEAIHAIGSVLAGHMWQLLRSGVPEGTDLNAAYYEQVRNLTAERWFEEYGEPEDRD
jgi:hypothetical protein